jgi:hypothetical protein
LDAPACCALSACGKASFFFWLASFSTARLQPVPADDELSEAEKHTHSGTRKSEVPIHALRQISAISGPKNAPRLMPI